MTLKQVTEALVFASQKPIAPKEIVAALRSAAVDCEDAEIKAFAKAKEAQIVEVLEQIRTELVETQRAFQLVEKVNGWQLVSDPRCGLWVRQLYPESKPTRLSGPALETLAIIAYRQPIMRADVEAVRGVAVDGVVQSLLERSLIRIAGRADIPGRPLLYETTEFFLEHFGLKSIDELPNSGELRKMSLPTAPAPAGKAALAAAPVDKTQPVPEAASPQAVPEAAPEATQEEIHQDAVSEASPEPEIATDPTPADTAPAEEATEENISPEAP